MDDLWFPWPDGYKNMVCKTTTTISTRTENSKLQYECYGSHFHKRLLVSRSYSHNPYSLRSMRPHEIHLITILFIKCRKCNESRYIFDWCTLAVIGNNGSKRKWQATVFERLRCRTAKGQYTFLHGFYQLFAMICILPNTWHKRRAAN